MARFLLRRAFSTPSNNSVIWANSYDGDLAASKLIEIETEIARQVATALGQPYGVIYQADAAQQPQQCAGRLAGLCLHAFLLRLSRQPRRQDASRVRKCLEDAVRRFPSLRDGLGAAFADLCRRDSLPLCRSTCHRRRRRSTGRLRPRGAPSSSIRKHSGAAGQMFALYFHGDVRSGAESRRTGITLQSKRHRAHRRIRLSLGAVRKLGSADAL